MGFFAINLIAFQTNANWHSHHPRAMSRLAMQHSTVKMFFSLSLSPTAFIFTNRNSTWLFPFIISMLLLIHTGLLCALLSAASRSFEFCISVWSVLCYRWKRKGLATIVKHFSNTVQVSVRKNLWFSLQRFVLRLYILQCTRLLCSSWKARIVTFWKKTKYGVGRSWGNAREDYAHRCRSDFWT